MKKPTAVFLSSREAVENAYNDQTVRALSGRLDFLPEIYCAEDFLRGTVNADALRKAEYVFSTWGMPALSVEQIGYYFPALKAVFYAAGTVQAFARPFLERGVKIFSAWGANAVPVAEVTVSEIILANKGFFQTLHRGGENGWNEHDRGKPYPGSYDTTVGIIGAGMIGTLVIKMLKNYRLRVFVYDPFLSDEKALSLDVEKVTDLPKLFEQCQVVSNHLANNAQTVNMIGKNCFDKMGKNAVFINTGRGQQVVESALIEALQEVPTRAAVLDVTWPEPPEKDSPLYTLPNVFLTPHMAGSIGREVARMGEYMLEEFLAFSEGRETRFSVRGEMLATMA